MQKHRLIINIFLLLSLNFFAQSPICADEPLPHVETQKQAAKYLQLAVEDAKKAGIRLNLGRQHGEVSAMLNAGQFDSVYQVLQNARLPVFKGLELINRYFFEMAAAGRTDELKQRLPSFKENLLVKPTTDRHSHITVDVLFKRPMLGGLAVFEARNGNLELAVEHLNAIKKLTNKQHVFIVDHYVEEVGRRLLFDKMDARCSKLISLFCGDDHRKAERIIRGIFAPGALFVEVEFLEALPIAYHPAGRSEIYFLLDDYRVPQEQKIACLDWAFENLQPAKESTLLSLRFEAIRNGVLPADSANESLQQYFELPSHEREKLLVMRRPLVESLLRAGDVAEASRVLLHAGQAADPSLIANVARRNFQLGKMEEGQQVLDLNVKSTKTKKRYARPKLLPLLLEAKEFDEAAKYAQFLDEKKSMPLELSKRIIELYQTLAKPADSSPEQLRSGVAQAIAGLSISDTVEFNRIANVPQFAANLVITHGPESAYQIANTELQKLFSSALGFPVGETIVNLLSDGKNSEAVEFAKCWNPEDKLYFFGRVRLAKPPFFDLDPESKPVIDIVNAFGDRLRNHTAFQRIQLRNAVKKQRKDFAIELARQAILVNPKISVSGFFTEHGWDHDLISCVTELEKNHPHLKGLTDRTLETLATDFSYSGKHDQAIECIQKISRYQKRIEICLDFAEITSRIDPWVVEPIDDWVHQK